MPTHTIPHLKKYVTVSAGDGKPHPILFDSGFRHSDMVPKNWIPVSAGFVLISSGTVHIPDVGSTSLNLNPKPQDHELIFNLIHE